MKTFRIFTYIYIFFICILLNSNPVFGMDVTLEWDANTEDIVIGYSVYCRNSDNEEFRHIEDVDGRETNTITLHDLSDDMNWCFVVTAFSVDTESGNSNEACTDDIDDDSNGGAGGGCFVNTANANDNDNDNDEKCKGIDCLWEALAWIIKGIGTLIFIVIILLLTGILS